MKTAVYSINCNGKLIDLSQPVVMGILNITPNSFYDGNVHNTIDQAITHCASMIKDGTTFIDIGAASSKPGSTLISHHEEIKRLKPILQELVKCFPDATFSLDTYNSTTAQFGFENGVSIINDISAGTIDLDMFEIVAKAKAPYIVMHMQGNPQTMQQAPLYTNVVFDIINWIRGRMEQIAKWNIPDIIIDPGFGFGKTVEQNFTLLKNLNAFEIFEKPILAGISRKSMVCKTLNVTPSEALNGTTALHMVSLQNGASILRVHDVREAMQAIALYKQLNTNTNIF